MNKDYYEIHSAEYEEMLEILAELEEGVSPLSSYPHTSPH